MKNQRNLSIILPLVVAIFTLVGCSDYDNGFTAKELHFTADFTREFGSFDPTQDWNLAERAYVTVTTSERKDVNVYTEKDGIYVQVGAFQNVSGTKKLEFDVIEDMQNLVVSDGDVALRAVVGGTVNFDDMTSVKGEVLSTRMRDVNRNEWETRYVIPANVTAEEEARVLQVFNQKYEGEYNTVWIPWTRMFVQQVHKGTSSYVDGFGSSIGVGSNHMDHLQIYNKNSDVIYDGFGDSHWEHVNDFNAGDHHATYEDIMGTTFMYNIDPADCPTEYVREGVNWVKQFLYHNSTDNKYHAEYILREIDGQYYLGFDFYATHPEGQEANKNMDVERDWIFNDWIIKLSSAENSLIPVKRLADATPQKWILAGEDLGGGFDIDYNDVVVVVERVSGQNKVRVTPLAAGGTLAAYLFFNGEGGEPACVGEIHQLFSGVSAARSGSYQPINVSGTLRTAKSVDVEVGADWTLTEDISKANNMGGFTIRVLPVGTEAMNSVLNYDDPAFDKATDVASPVEGVAPYIICVPYSYTLANVPVEGQKTTTIWGWPGETINIAKAYTEFEEWVKDKENNQNWYAYPNPSYVVSTAGLPGSGQTSMTEEEIEYVSDPNHQELDVPDGDNPGGSTSDGADEAIWSLSQTEVTLEVGTTSNVSVSVASNDYEGTPVFTSSNESVATLTELSKYYLEISAVGGGEADITITWPAAGKYAESSKTIHVTVNRKDATFLISPDNGNWSDHPVSNSNIELIANGTYQINLYGGNTSTGETPTYASSNTSVATVSNSGLITAHAAGTATITASSPQTSIYNAATATVSVTVVAATDPDPDPTPSGSGKRLSETKLSSYILDIKAGSVAGTYTISYGKDDLKVNVTSITLKYSGIENSDGIAFHSGWDWYRYVTDPGVSEDTVTIEAADLQYCLEQNGGHIYIEGYNGKVLYLDVQ